MSDRPTNKNELLGSTPPSLASEDATEERLDNAEPSIPSTIYSQMTSNHNTGSNIDDHRLARQKRRRTSPEDHAILEAEYERNPKPDKAARMAIVNRVALGEKEVQIWFQNRRQLTRRKSKPLLPHEIFANIKSSQGYTEDATSSFSASHSSQQQPPSSQSSTSESQTNFEAKCTKIRAEIPTEDTAKKSEHIGVPPNSGGEEGVQTFNDMPQDSPNTQESVPCVADDHDFVSSMIKAISNNGPSKRRPGYLANRRGASFAVHDEHNERETGGLQNESAEAGRNDIIEDAARTTQPLGRTPSLVKLSLNLDGKAEVTTRTGNTPSPPRSQSIRLSSSAPRAKAGLQRSYSALEAGRKSFLDTSTVPYLNRPMTGRSRDARTWEFYCDSDSRNALTEQAEREERGSATAAIGLIRSHNNNGKIMAANPHKRNAQTQKPDQIKRLKGDDENARKPKLGRACSSLARLQTIDGNIEKRQKLSEVADKKDPKLGSQPSFWQEYEGDSDKENWKPGTQRNNPRRTRPAHSQHPVRILEESLRIPSQSSSLDALMRRDNASSRGSSTKLSSDETKEISSPEADKEVTTLAGASAPTRVEDLDCVQNLLSLSQAVWQ